MTPVVPLSSFSPKTPLHWVIKVCRNTSFPGLWFIYRTLQWRTSFYFLAFSSFFPPKLNFYSITMTPWYLGQILALGDKRFGKLWETGRGPLRVLPALVFWFLFPHKDQPFFNSLIPSPKFWAWSTACFFLDLGILLLTYIPALTLQATAICSRITQCPGSGVLCVCVHGGHTRSPWCQGWDSLIYLVATFCRFILYGVKVKAVFNLTWWLLLFQAPIISSMMYYNTTGVSSADVVPPHLDWVHSSVKTSMILNERSNHFSCIIYVLSASERKTHTVSNNTGV